MPVLDDGVKEVLENRVGLLVTSHTAHGHDEGVTWGGQGGGQRRLSPARKAWAPGSSVDCVCMCVRVQGSSLDTSGSELRRLRLGKNGEGRLGKVKVASGGVGGRLRAGQRRKSLGGQLLRILPCQSPQIMESSPKKFQNLRLSAPTDNKRLERPSYFPSGETEAWRERASPLNHTMSRGLRLEAGLLPSSTRPGRVSLEKEAQHS